jgi:signal transduction histidine kinase
LPVLLITALSDQRDRIAGLAAGADDFLKKPIDTQEVGLRVAAFLRLRAQDLLIRDQLSRLRTLQAAKDDLVAMLVHDVRGPLASLMALLALSCEDLRESGDSPVVTDLEHAIGAAKSINRTLDETLRVRLLEEGHLQVERSAVDLEVVAREAIEAFDGVLTRRQVTVTTSLEGPARVSLDGRLVRRALENLINNAVFYSPRGARIDLAVRANGAALELDVADRGPGVPDALKGSLFAKFGSLEAMAGGGRRGIGLGLYLVKLVAEGHGGHASVHDREGGGSTFRLTLPVEVARLQANEQAPATPSVQA